MPKYEYECSLSGITSPGDMPHAEDGLDDLPVGWFELRLSRRVPNPKWVLIQQVKEAMVSALISQYPPEVREAQEVAIRVQLEAQFFAMENATSPYITDVETIYLSPPESSEDVAEAIDSLRETVGLPPFEEGDDDDEEEAPAPAPVEPPPVVGKRQKKALPST